MTYNCLLYTSLYLGRKVFTEINKCRSFPANWKRKLTNRVEKGFSSYRRCGGRLLRSIFSRTSIRTFLVVLGVVSLSLCAVTCRISATERQHMTSELPVTVAQASGNAATEPSTTERVTVLQISESDKDGRTTVEISLSGRASCRSFTLSDPERLVVDVEGAVLLSRPDPIPVEDGIIEKIRVGQFNPSVVRVVFDLSRATSYSVVQTEDKDVYKRQSIQRVVTG